MFFRQFKIIVLLLFVSQFTEAATIRAVKGRKVLFFMEQGEFSPGQRVLAVTREGSRGRISIKGILLVRFVRGGKAIGILQKGRAEVGMTLTRVPSRKKRSSVKRRTSLSQKKWAAGVLLGGTFNSLNAKFLVLPPSPQVEEVKMTGTGLIAKAHMDLDVTNAFSLRVLAGLDGFKAKKQSKIPVCGVIDPISGGSRRTTTNCFSNINYLTFDGWLRYAFINTTNKVWIGIGGGIRTPNKKSSRIENTALKSESIGTIGVGHFGLGLDLGISHQMFIPIQAHYTLFPKSKDKSTSLSNISAIAGISFKF